MNREKIISALDQLGNQFSQISSEDMDLLINEARNENTWFTPENIRRAITASTNYLNRSNLEIWLDKYKYATSAKSVGLVLAGNIPLVGLHDIIAVLCAGHIAIVKLSSKDTVLFSYLIQRLEIIDPEVASRIILVDQLKGIDAVIATGSDNTARYFHQYFDKYPNIIRKNRSSVGILNGNESSLDLRALGQDIFSYFGLGCRNISKLLVPNGYVFDHFFESVTSFHTVMEYHKYHNNYDYNKSVLLVNSEPHLDNGFILVRKTTDLVSPISVLFYEEYESEDSIQEILEPDSKKIQCIVSSGGWYPGSIATGQAQMPELWDYADHVDTMDFLLNL